MIEPPSPHLVKTLLELKLCSAGDLRRCRRRVRRLARDLPAFDSVWIDALLQARRLTPFQAKLLGSPESQRLCVGPCVLIDRLGGNKDADTYLARQRDGNERCTLKLVNASEDVRDAVQSRLEILANLTQGESHPSIVAPRVAMRVNDQIALVSRFVPGPHLAGLLVRRGRFPAPIVVDIVAQLIDGLARFEQLGVVHGDVQLTNVRLTENGAAVLVDFGVRPAVAPEFTIHSTLRPERCDGTAPELIGSGCAPTSTSDIYALGCMLWHLLAGRPPYMTADTLAKLACHQTKRIIDVREIAPDVPAHLADAVRAFTSLDPGDRPQTFREIRDRWNSPRRSGRQRLAGFAAGFNTAARRVPVAAREPSGSKWPLMLVLLFVLSGASLTLIDNGKFTVPLSIREMAGNFWKEPPADVSEVKPAVQERIERNPQPGYADLPEPNAEGVILLDTDGPYSVRRVEMVGALTLRGTPSRQPVVAIENEPLDVLATQLTLENVHFRRLPPAGTTSSATSVELPALLKVRAQNLVVQSCSFDIDPTATPGSEGVTKGAAHETGWANSAAKDVRRPAMIDWKAIDESDASGGTISLKNCVFLGPRPALALSSVPQTLQAANCLKAGAGTFLTLARPPRPEQQFRSVLAQCTLRESDGFLAVQMPEAASPSGLISVDATECVFHLPGDSSAFVEFVAGRPLKETNLRVEVVGKESLANRGFAAARWVDSSQRTTTELQSEAILLEGIQSPPFEFVGKASANPGDSAVKSFEGRQHSAAAPGINPSLLRAPGR